MLKTRIINKLLTTIGVQGWWLESVHGLSIPVRGSPDFIGLSNTRYRETPLYRWLAKRHNDFNAEAYIVDVGAFVGEFALACADLMGRQVRYVGFEPSLNAAAYTQRLFEINGFENASIVSVALWNEPAFLAQFRNAEFASGASVIQDFATKDGFQQSGTVPAFRGDDLLQLAETQPVGLLKVDVEGAEALVLEGLLETIQRNRPIIVFEALPWSCRLYPSVTPICSDDVQRKMRTRLIELQQIFENESYSISHIEKYGGEERVFCLVEAADQIRQISLLNYVARPAASKVAETVSA